MTREALDAAQARRDALREELARLDRELDALAPLTDRRRELERELREAQESLARSSRRALPLLASVRVASPCDARWEDMEGDERVRACGLCDESVYDLSAMTAREAEALLHARGESLCVRFYERADGTVMTSDCATGTSRRRRRRWMTAGAAVAVLAAGVAASGATIDAEPLRPLPGRALERVVNETAIATPKRRA